VPRVDTLLYRLGVTWRTLLKELSAFGIVGAVCFVLDLRCSSSCTRTSAWAP